MRIRILETVRGDGWEYGPGEHDLPDNVAREILDAGKAEPYQTFNPAALPPAGREPADQPERPHATPNAPRPASGHRPNGLLPETYDAAAEQAPEAARDQQAKEAERGEGDSGQPSQAQDLAENLTGDDDSTRAPQLGKTEAQVAHEVAQGLKGKAKAPKGGSKSPSLQAREEEEPPKAPIGPAPAPPAPVEEPKGLTAKDAPAKDQPKDAKGKK